MNHHNDGFVHMWFARQNLKTVKHKQDRKKQLHWSGWDDAKNAKRKASIIK